MHRTEGTNHVNNEFIDGPPGTVVTSDFMNAIQEELAYIIEEAGLTLDTAATETHTQLLDALQAGTLSLNFDDLSVGGALDVSETILSGSQIGIGISSFSSWDSSIDVFEMFGGYVSSVGAVLSFVSFGCNNYYDAFISWKYMRNGGASVLSLDEQDFLFYSAAVGVADAPITWVELLHMSDTGIIFNDGAADIDIRMEGTGAPNLFFLDAGNNRIGINTNSPLARLHVNDATGGAPSILAEVSDSDVNQIRIKNSDAYWNLQIQANEDFAISHDGGVYPFFIRNNCTLDYSLVIGPAGEILCGKSTPGNIGASQLLLEGGLVALKELATAPTADSGYSKIYPMADNKMRYQDGDGDLHIFITNDIIGAKGYFGGGNTGAVTNVIDGFIFMLVTSINPAATLNVARENLAGINSSTKGYFGGGLAGAVSNEIDGIDFSDDSAINPAATLNVARDRLAGISSKLYGYWCGGVAGAVSNEIDGIDFSDDSAINPAAILLTGKRNASGANSEGFGIIGAGWIAARTAAIEGITFDAVTCFSLSATLSAARTSPGAFQSGGVL